MDADLPAETGADVELIAASLRADAADLDTFVEALAVKLDETLPAGVEVERRRSGLRGPKRVQAITVDLGAERLTLRVTGHDLETARARVSGGITIKTEPLEIDAWLTALSEALVVQAQRSASTRQALERLLIG